MALIREEPLENLLCSNLGLDACGEGTDLMNLAELRRLQGKFPRAIYSLRQAIPCFERADAAPLRELAEQRLREVQRIVEIGNLDPQLN